MQDSPTYGFEFIERYRKTARSTPVEYAILQAVKAMDRHELSKWLSQYSELMAELVLHVPAERAAELYHRDQLARLEQIQQASRGTFPFFVAMLTATSMAVLTAFTLP